MGFWPVFGVGLTFPLHFLSSSALEGTPVVLILLLVLGCASVRPRSALLSPKKGIFSPSLCLLTAQQTHGGRYASFLFCSAAAGPLPIALLGPVAPPGPVAALGTRSSPGTHSFPGNP